MKLFPLYLLMQEHGQPSRDYLAFLLVYTCILPSSAEDLLFSPMNLFSPILSSSYFGGTETHPSPLSLLQGDPRDVQRGAEFNDTQKLNVQQ